MSTKGVAEKGTFSKGWSRFDEKKGKSGLCMSDLRLPEPQMAWEMPGLRQLGHLCGRGSICPHTDTHEPGGIPGDVGPVPIDAVILDDECRIRTGIDEFDRVLGGGLVAGSLVLIGGDPGIGKSTLMLQALYGLSRQGSKVLYVSGEESVKQIRLRSKRLETVSNSLYVVSEVDLDLIMQMVVSEKPDVLVIDFHPDHVQQRSHLRAGQRHPGP